MSENSRGCWLSARAKVEPAFTSARKAATRWLWRSSSASSLRAVSARSSGRPDDTSPASCRVHTASVVALNTGRVNRRWPSEVPPPAAVCPVCTSSTVRGTNAWARSMLRADLAVSASSRPLRVWPWASRASKEKAGMNQWRYRGQRGTALKAMLPPR